MYFSTAFLLPILPLTLAQYNYGTDGGSTTTSAHASATPASTTSSSGPIHTVLVGNGGLTFSPDNITAAAGDSLEFHFFSPAHSVAQSAFDAPCAPLSNGTSFYSGPVTTSSGENADVFTVVVNDTNPIWIYCAIPSHCEAGMAAVINPPSDGSATLAQYVAAAAKISNTVAPANAQGGVLGPAKAATSSSSSSSSSSTGSSASAAATTKNAGVETRGGVRWIVLAITGVAAVGVGSLMI